MVLETIHPSLASKDAQLKYLKDLAYQKCVNAFKTTEQHKSKSNQSKEKTINQLINQIRESLIIGMLGLSLDQSEDRKVLTQIADAHTPLDQIKNILVGDDDLVDAVREYLTLVNGEDVEEDFFGD
jgi:hypothetical protein